MDDDTPLAGFERGTVATPSVATHYVRRGEGPPLVFVHGAIMDHRMWAPQLDALAEEFTVVAYDVRGHGLTGGSPAERYSMDRYAADLDALLSALGVERSVLVGLSMGGAIAQVYAATYPERVAGVVLADTFTPAPTGLAGRFLFANLQLFALLSPFVSYRRLNAVQLWVGDRLVPGVGGDGETIRRLVDTGPELSPAEFRKVVRSLVAFVRSDFDVARVEAPALVLHGEHVPAVLSAYSSYMAHALPDAEYAVVPGAGHASNLDSPVEFTERVRRFAAERSAPGRAASEEGASEA
jgi:pimeloyl-ACP methyl ester carboxylesterase